MRFGTNNTERMRIKADGSWGKAPAGTTLQTVYVEKVNGYSSSSASWQNVTGLSASITPKSTSSKILVIMNIAMGGANEWGGSHWRIKRNSTVLSVGTHSGHQVNSRIGGLIHKSAHGTYTRVMTILDSPSSTSAVTYQAQAYPEQDAGSGIVYVNDCSGRSVNYSGNGVSSIILQEIAG